MADSVNLPIVVGWNGDGVQDSLGEDGGSKEVELCLVGSLILDKPFNMAAIRVAIFRLWHFVNNLEMEEVKGDRFIFFFRFLSW